MSRRVVAVVLAAFVSVTSADECDSSGNCSAQGSVLLQSLQQSTKKISVHEERSLPMNRQDPPATYDAKGSGIAAWASQYASLRTQKLTSSQISEFNAAVDGHPCVQTLASSPDRCKPDADGCESKGAVEAQSKCRYQPTAKIATSGGIKIVSFSGKCTKGKSSSCYGAHSCTAGLLETEPVYLQSCGAFAFEWKAEGGSDWYQVIIAIKKDGHIVRTEIYRGKRMTKYKTGNVWVSQEMGSGWYSVAFYTASYDRTNGMALGAKLYVKPFQYQNFVRGNAADGCDIPEPVPTPQPTPAPTPAPTPSWDCDCDGPSGWSDAKKQWCCQTVQKGCE